MRPGADEGGSVGRARRSAIRAGERSRPLPAGARSRDEAGFASLTLPLLVWFTTVATVVLVDLGGYLIAASRAQSLADGAALAAVSAEISALPRGGPDAEAAAVVAHGGGRLEACSCPLGASHARVVVSVAVPGLVMPRLGASRVEAEATARLAAPEDLAPGPTRERSRWRRPPG